MTHTLHRVGDFIEQDYVVLIMPSKDINHEGSGAKMRRYLELALEAGAIKIGDARLGNEYFQGGVDKVLANLEDRAVVHAVFKDQETLIKALRAYKEADLGLSVVVSGIFDEVHKCCKTAGLERHTVNQSMGRWGKTERLPSPEILQLNTMCGHGMVSVDLIHTVVADIKSGECTAEEGAERLFEPCMCGVFNPHRAALVLKKIVSQEKS